MYKDQKFYKCPIIKLYDIENIKEMRMYKYTKLVKKLTFYKYLRVKKYHTKIKQKQFR